MISRLQGNVSASLFILLFHIQNALSKPLEKDVLTALLDPQSDANLQQSKQFIGTSVIGGLMWPVLLTLTFTAIMARVPDALQRLLTGTGSNYRYSNHQRMMSKDNDYLDNIMKTLLKAIDTVENMKLATPLYRRSN